MGKSSKKAKSDRINALRKQYDAFLEQDKKRKERNEYILGKLDKMRYSTALVPVRRKITSLDTPPAVHHLGYQQDCCTVHDSQSSITNKGKPFVDFQITKNEDPFLIQEISKKYILIPKTTTLCMNSYAQNVTPNQNTQTLQDVHPLHDTIPVKDVKSSIDENTNWKSKYEILNILKNEEKDSSYNKMGDENFSVYNVDKQEFLNNHEHIANNYNINNEITGDHFETPEKSLNKLPEIELPTRELSSDISYKLQSEVDIKGLAHNNNIIVDTTNMAKTFENIKLNDDDSNATNIVEINNPSTELDKYERQPEANVHIPPQSPKEIVASNSEYVNVDSEHLINNDFAIHDQNVPTVNEIPADTEQFVQNYDEEVTLVMNPHEQIKEINNGSPLLRNSDHENSIEVCNIQEVPQKEDDQITNVYNVEEQADSQIDIESTYENNDNVETIVGQTENPAEIMESTEDYKCETGDTFYPEQTDANYAYQQGEYQEGQEYAYYEGTQPEAYPQEISGQEEVPQQYEPHYEQQYVESDQVNFDQSSNEQQPYDQQPQQYLESEGYHQEQPGFEYDQQNYETQEQVEQVQHFEDGYIEQQHTAETAGEDQVGGNLENQYLEETAIQQIGESVETEKPDAEGKPMTEEVIS